MTGSLVDLRRRLHRSPEVGLELPLTRSILLEELADLPVDIILGTTSTSVIAVLRGGMPGPTVLLRSDMDALPIVERAAIEYAATGSAMHACGHDLHMAGLVGAARLLSAHRDTLAGKVVFAFQPGEEGHGGALAMLDEGLLDATGELPVAAFALHVIADLPHGVVFGRPGPIMAAYGVIDIEIAGRGAHGGRPHEGIDPVPIAAETITALHAYVDRRFDKFDPVVVTVGVLEAGSAPNVVSERVTMRVGVRTFSEANTSRVAVELPRLVEGIAAAHGASATAVHRPVMGPTVNDPASASVVAEAARSLFGDARYRELEFPRAGSEDFSEVLRRVPGAFAYVGAARPGGHPTAGNHSPTVVFDDSILDDVARLLAELASRTLQNRLHPEERP